MNDRCSLIVFAVTAIGLMALQGCGGESQQVSLKERTGTLKLGAEFCDAYLGKVQTALKTIQGVENVDLQSQKGHALVTAQGSVTSKQLTTAVDALEGDGWSCTAELVKEE